MIQRGELVILFLGLSPFVACGSFDDVITKRDGGALGKEIASGTDPPVGRLPTVGSEDYEPRDTKGVFDCPTVALPAYRGAVGLSSDAVFSSTFQSVCASCHGESGEGSGRYPAINNVPADRYLSVVRTGKGVMPGFDATAMSDDAIRKDLAALAGGVTALPPPPSSAWTPQEVTRAYDAGLAMWRKPDKEGAACASCHTPDAVDLAMIGYSDATIFRRGLMHLAGDDVAVIRDFIHAQRRKFEVKAPCDPFAWHVFQPGGTPLPGETILAQDQALVDLLKARGLKVAQRLSTASDVTTAWDELAKLDVRKLPIGTRMPRWTEDAFNGAEHRSANDWITAVPRIPVDAQWYAGVDAYLQNPTDDALWELVGHIEDWTKPGYTKRVSFDDPWSKSVQTFEDGATIGETMRMKAAAALVASHFFRMELLGRKGWFDLPDVPRRKSEIRADVFRQIGPGYQEDHCYNSGAPCNAAQYDWLPPIAQAEFDRDMFYKQAKTFVDPWWTLGFLFDPTLAQGGTDVLHYWQSVDPEINFPRRDAHQPFTFSVMQVRRFTFLDEIKAKTTKWNVIFPQGPQHAGLVSSLEQANMPVGDPILSLFWFAELGGIVIDAPEEKGATDHDFLVLKTNLMRLFTWKMRDRLKAGGTVGDKRALRDTVIYWQNKLTMLAESGRADLVADASYYADSARIAREVLDLIETARDL